ncbi:MAG: metallophosphoesterase, partial [Deltaproteobacteria bacterium]|nr:metallophosphoesterase [Deltaproteobacteria bacterium]
VQISDVHIGLIVGENRLEKILDRVIAAEPDILISTGDLVDGQMDDVSTLTEMFRKIPAKMGKYAITGNHEFYAGLNRALKFTKNAGFTVLRGEALSINGFLNIAGVDDMAGNSYGLTRNISEKALLSALDRDKFTLFLKHRPLLEKDATGLYDLQLSGHVHKGQIFPFSLVTMLFYPEDAGMLALDNNAFLYVSRGCGTWGPPIRFLSPPEVTIIDLVAAG